MGVGLLLLVWVAGVGAQDPVCLPGCSCDPRHFLSLEPPRSTFLLHCDVSGAGAGPAWAGLGETFRELSIRLDLGPGTRLTREHLPRGRAVVGVEVRGVGSLAADALHSVQASLLWLKLVMTTSAPAPAMPFLQGLPRLQLLSLEYIYHAQAAAPANVTGAPFKGSGLRLDKFLLYGGNVASLGDDFFLGLAASELQMGTNGLTAFPWKALASIRGLRKLEVYNNLVAVLQDGATEGLGLEQLVLRRTHTESLAGGALRGVARTLRKLLIAECLLTEVPVDALAPLERLESVEFSDNPISAFPRPLHGSVCPTWFSLDYYLDDGRGLATLHDHAFQAVSGCLRHVALSGTRMRRFPSLAFRDLEDAGSIYFGSEVMTRLEAEALAGVRVHVLTISAPLEVVEPGAFSGLRRHPLSLTLSSTRLSNASFFFDYPGRTFSSLAISSSSMECSCELEAIRQNLRAHNEGRQKEKALYMNCLDAGTPVYLHSSQAYQDLFANCSNITILEPRQISAGAAVRGLLAPLLLLAALLLSA